MIDLKITIDQIKNYLGTGLKCETIHKTIDRVELKNKIFTLDGISADHNRAPYFTSNESFCTQFGCIGKYFQSNEFKPICYRLSDLDKFIPELGFVPAEKLFYGAWLIHFKSFINTDKQLDRTSFNDIQKLFQWHFWPFEQEYFTEGLVIDKLKTT